MDDEIQSLKRWKLELSTDIDSLTASPDQLAEKAESSRDMSILVKSNAMSKACNEKTAENACCKYLYIFTNRLLT